MSASAPAMRRLGFSAAVVITIVAATFSVRIGMADSLASRDPSAALAWWPWQAEASARELQTLLGQADPESSQRARDRALTMLQHSPLAGAAYAGMARLAEAQGAPTRAAALMVIAAQRSPRERLTHAWLADRHMERLDFVRALRHFDQILRLSPRQAHTMMPALVSLAQHPEGSAVISNWLGEFAPPWRDRFLAAWASRAGSELMLDGVFDPLRRAPHPLTAKERGLWVARLVHQGRVSKAHFIWIDGLPAIEREQVGNVFDGGFELPPSQGGFGWRIGKVSGATIRQQSGAGVQGSQALAIEFRHRRVPFQHVQQTLALPPGDYELVGRVRLDDLRTARGLKWFLNCGRRKTELGESPAFSGRSDWTDFNVPFSVPANDCPAQLLQLRLDARVAAEQLIGGRAWFDSLRVLRRGRPDPASLNGNSMDVTPSLLFGM